MHHLGAMKEPLAEWQTDVYWDLPAHGPDRGRVNDILPMVLGAGRATCSN